MWKKAKAFPSIRKREKTREACAKRSFFLVERVTRRETKTGNAREFFSFSLYSIICRMSSTGLRGSRAGTSAGWPSAITMLICFSAGICRYSRIRC